MRFRALRAPSVLLVALILAAQPAAAQPAAVTPQAIAARAQSFLQANQADSAIRVLEALYEGNPRAAVGRLVLANAYRRKGDLDKALEAYLAVISPPLSATIPSAQRSQARFNAASLYVKRGATSEALTQIEALRASGSFDMDLVRDAADFESVRSESRFQRAVTFHASDFAQPFVEPVRVIHEWVAEGKGHQFGWIARGIGDVDGDKVPDIVTSAPGFGATSTSLGGAGRVYAYSGRSGRLLWTQTGKLEPTAAPPAGQSGAATQPTLRGETLGVGLEGAGDVNADGIPDVIAGAPPADRAYVYSGRDGRLLLTLGPIAPGEGFGTSASGVGDQNGDGYDDVIVGAPGSNATAPGAGRAYVFSGKDGAVLHTLDGEKAGDAFGSIVNGYRDETHAFLSIGAPAAGPRTTGRVYVFAGLSKRPKFVIESDSSGSALGAMFTTVVGDLDGDGVPDVYATDFTNGAKGLQTGRAYVHSGSDGRRLHNLTGEEAGDMFGDGAANVGDINGDGRADLLIGAWQYDNVAPSAGRVYLHSGKDGRVLRTITARIAGETLGFDAAGVGDVDGDGVNDLLLTGGWSNVKGFRSGRVFLISGK